MSDTKRITALAKAYYDTGRDVFEPQWNDLPTTTKAARIERMQRTLNALGAEQCEQPPLVHDPITD